MTRRSATGAILGGILPEAAFAQRAAVPGDVPANTVWLNANENPDGPPREATEAMAKAIAEAGRYNHRVFVGLNEALARRM
jgi:histidinol-phosphate/aromatic aminotransferase/cobyric acid decarboxylase-like protein